MAARGPVLAVRAGGLRGGRPRPDRRGDLLPRLRVPSLSRPEGPRPGVRLLEPPVRAGTPEPAGPPADLRGRALPRLPLPPNWERLPRHRRARLQQHRRLHRPLLRPLIVALLVRLAVL